MSNRAITAAQLEQAALPILDCLVYVRQTTYFCQPKSVRLKTNILLFVFLLLSVCTYSQPTKIYLSPKAAGGANQSQFIDSLKFFSLEQNKQVKLGSDSYIQITKKYFLILSYTEKSISIFSKTGQFVNVINYKKLGERASSPRYDKTKDQLIFFFPNNNYALTEKDGIEIKNDFTNPKNDKYFKKYIIDLKDSSFQFQKAKPIAFDILSAYSLKDDYYSTYEISVNRNYKDSLDYEVKIYKDDKFVKGYFPYHKQNETRYLYAKYIGAITQETNIPNRFYITRPYVDTIYALENDKVTPAYQLILPMENSVPKSFFDTPFKKATDRDNYERNNGWLLKQIYPIQESNRYMLFTLGFMSNYGQYIYDKKTAASYNFQKIKPDSSSYFLPLIGVYYNYAKNDDKYYRILTAEELKTVLEQNKGKVDRLPKELQACFKDPKNPSPLIVEFVIKNN